MKRTLICILSVIILAGCFCGCARNDNQDMIVSPAPTMTAVPEILPKPDEGVVDDTDGIIEDEEDKLNEKRDSGENAVSTPKASATPKPTASTAPSASPSANPES